jgi:hypothetical protein
MLKIIRDHYKTYNFFPIESSIRRYIHAPKDWTDWLRNSSTRLSHGKSPASPVTRSRLSNPLEAASQKGKATWFPQGVHAKHLHPKIDFDRKAVRWY